MSCQGRIPAPFELSEEWSVLRGAVSAGNTPRDRERKRKEEAAQVLIKMLLAVGNYFDVPPEKICRRQSFIFIFGNIELGTHRNFSFSLRFFLKVGKWKVAFSIFGSLFIYLFLLSFDSFQEFSFLVLDHSKNWFANFSRFLFPTELKDFVFRTASDYESFNPLNFTSVYKSLL